MLPFSYIIVNYGGFTMNISGSIPGYCGKKWPWDFVLDKLPNSGTLLEVGTACGKSACTFAELFHERGMEYSIHTVDMYYPFEFRGRIYYPKQMNDYIRAVVKHWPNVSYSVGDFFNMEEFPIPTVFFYDGHHSYESTTLAMNMMSTAEVLVIDDIQMPEVLKAVENFSAVSNRSLHIHDDGPHGVAVLL